MNSRYFTAMPDPEGNEQPGPRPSPYEECAVCNPNEGRVCARHRRWMERRAQRADAFSERFATIHHVCPACGFAVSVTSAYPQGDPKALCRDCRTALNDYCDNRRVEELKEDEEAA